MKKILFFLLMFIMLASGCAYKYMPYVADKSLITKNSDIQKYKLTIPQYKIKSGDVLLVKFYTPNDKTVKEFNANANIMNNSQTSVNMKFLPELMVNDSGYIFNPVLGYVKVSGLTLAEATREIRTKALHFIQEAEVFVKILNFNVTFLGEIAKQGTITFEKDQMNLLEAFGQIGGVSENGNKKNIKILRPVDSSYIVYRVDISKSDIIEKQQFYLQPGDIVVVEPLRSVRFRSNLSEIMIYISLFTTVLTAIALLKK